MAEDTSSHPPTLIELLSASGPEAEPADFLPLVYDELRRLARAYLARERVDHSLDATALVHEAYLRVAGDAEIDWEGRTHFFRAGAQAMRRLLVDHARQRGRRKRGGDWQRVSFNAANALGRNDLAPEDFLALDQALDRLAQLDPRYARIVELRFFAGLTVDEAARTLDVSKRTAEGDWAFARAWLRRELARQKSG